MRARPTTMILLAAGALLLPMTVCVHCTTLPSSTPVTVTTCGPGGRSGGISANGDVRLLSCAIGVARPPTHPT